MFSCSPAGLTFTHTLFLVPLQDVVPLGALQDIHELIVPESKREAAKAEAATLPSVEIGMVGSFVPLSFCLVSYDL